MTGLTDLEALEKQAFRRFYEDGIFDIFLGVMLATMAIGALITDWSGSEVTGLVAMFAIAFVAVVALMTIRRHLLRSRLGEFKPGPTRRHRISLTRLALLGSVVVGLVLFGVVAAGGVSIASLEVLMPLIWFLNAVVVLGAMAYFLDVPRFYLYGFLFGSVMPVMIWPDVLWDYRVAPVIALGGPAVITIAIGLFKLSRFLRDYPIRPGLEGSDA
jgi:hypothetical protein